MYALVQRAAVEFAATWVDERDRAFEACAYEIARDDIADRVWRAACPN
jgi:hypothetical protein